MKTKVECFKGYSIIECFFYFLFRSLSTGLVRWQQQAQQQRQPPMNVTDEIQQQNQKPTTVTTTITDSTKDTKLDEQPATKDQQPTSYLGKLYQQSKELVVFYKDGLKLLWSNNKTSKALQRKVQHEGYVLNRSEFQLVRHSPYKHDICIILTGLLTLL